MSVNSVSEYIERLDENGKAYVQDFIAFMVQSYPQLHLKICFSMPMWLVGKKMNEGYVAVSAAKNHVSVHFSNEDFVLKLGNKLPACKTGKRCINIQYGDKESFQRVKESVGEFLKE